jgi:hypothetical protein
MTSRGARPLLSLMVTRSATSAWPIGVGPLRSVPSSTATLVPSRAVRTQSLVTHHLTWLKSQYRSPHPPHSVAGTSVPMPVPTDIDSLGPRISQ